MPPKKKVKGGSFDMEEMIRREDELKAVLDGKNEEIRAIKSKASEDGKKSFLAFKKVIDDGKKEVNKWKMKHDATTRVIARQAVEAKKEVSILKRKLNVVDKLMDSIECPVCFDIPRTGPVPVCPNGHLVCQDCKRDICPTCRVQMGNGRSLLAMTIIENIDHKCKFDDCDDNFPMDKVEEHEKVCRHITVPTETAR